MRWEIVFCDGSSHVVFCGTLDEAIDAALAAYSVRHIDDIDVEKCRCDGHPLAWRLSGE